MYGLRFHPNGEVYLYSGREYNFPNSIMIWMCISNSGPNLIRLVPETMKPLVYHDILDELAVSPSITGTRGFIHNFNHFNRNPTISTWFRQQQSLRQLAWAKGSPQIMPLTSVFEDLVIMLNSCLYRSIATVDDLCSAVMDLWDRRINNVNYIWSKIYDTRDLISQSLPS